VVRGEAGDRQGQGPPAQEAQGRGRLRRPPASKETPGSPGVFFGAPVGEADLNLIRETVVRYQIAHMTPNDLAPAAASRLTGFCVGFDRSGGTDPAASVLAALKDTTLPMIAYTACVKDGMKGRVPLWVVSVSSTGANSAQAVGRSVQNSYVYALERRAGVWIVTAAKLTGRS
jgi:hypothetical protein